MSQMNLHREWVVAGPAKQKGEFAKAGPSSPSCVRVLRMTSLRTSAGLAQQKSGARNLGQRTAGLAACLLPCRLLLNPGPRIFQRQRPVEDQIARRGVRIKAEVAHPFELEPVF